VNASYGGFGWTVSPSSVTPGGTATDTITLPSGDGYAGTVTFKLRADLFAERASDLPSCTGPSSPLTLSSGTATGTVTVTTTGATSSETGEAKDRSGQGLGWELAAAQFLRLMLFFVSRAAAQLADDAWARWFSW